MAATDLKMVRGPAADLKTIHQLLLQRWHQTDSLIRASPGHGLGPVTQLLPLAPDHHVTSQAFSPAAATDILVILIRPDLTQYQISHFSESSSRPFFQWKVGKLRILLAAAAREGH